MGIWLVDTLSMWRNFGGKEREKQGERMTLAHVPTLWSNLCLRNIGYSFFVWLKLCVPVVTIMAVCV